MLSMTDLIGGIPQKPKVDRKDADSREFQLGYATANLEEQRKRLEEEKSEFAARAMELMKLQASIEEQLSAMSGQIPPLGAEAVPPLMPEAVPGMEGAMLPPDLPGGGPPGPPPPQAAQMGAPFAPGLPTSF